MSEQYTLNLEKTNERVAKSPLLNDIHHLTSITADMDRLISFYGASSGRGRQRGNRCGLDAALRFPGPGRGPPRGSLEKAGRPGRGRAEARRVENGRVRLEERTRDVC